MVEYMNSLLLCQHNIIVVIFIFINTISNKNGILDYINVILNRNSEKNFMCLSQTCCSCFLSNMQ